MYFKHLKIYSNTTEKIVQMKKKNGMNLTQNEYSFQDRAHIMQHAFDFFETTILEDARLSLEDQLRGMPVLLQLIKHSLILFKFCKNA